MANSLSITRRELTDLLSCPVSHQAMTDPVVDLCNHTFERRHIEGSLLANGTCPLSHRPMRVDQLLPSRIVRLAIEILAQLPPMTEASSAQEVDFSHLAEEERGILNVAIDALRAQRIIDMQNHVPVRLAEPQTFGDRVVRSCKKVYNC